MTFNESYQNLLTSLQKIYPVGEAKSIIRIIFEDVFKVYSTDYQKIISPSEINQLAEIEERLLRNEPIQYILGEADFYGLKFKVNSNVLIPRSETEELVLWILESVPQKSNYTILDIGTGSGCIPITLHQKCTQWETWASDVSSEAIQIAKENADLNQVDINFLTFDILDPTQWQFEKKFNLIVSNPPYIPENEKVLMPTNVLENEPHLALFVDNQNPLIFYDTISDFALQNLIPGGFLFFEMNEFNAKEVQDLLIKKNFQNIEIQKDIYGKNRMIRAIL
ncbi:MAG: peptide chain release factor N(5)-glutamine methyltransferase [Bacteroidetes bacterium]|nr:peptide chain release factor N(5)-glutamine methyltransferase [Bacteroidota bacterium]MDF1864733.1 peptide chain release factor N(5)-glutamine methyltransferase [Saprospiraceae bacterium]